MFTDELANMGYHELTTDDAGHIRGRSGPAREHERWLMWAAYQTGLCPEQVKGDTKCR